MTAPDGSHPAVRCAALGALLILGVAGRPAAAAPVPPWSCLPPIFDGGERLHPLPGPSVFWLELLLRQHEICWRPRSGEVRILLAGSSSVFGFPLPPEQTFAHRLNEHFAATGVRAHVFNLAFVNPYQVRDAVIINEARRFAPDIILYAFTMADFDHTAPLLFPPVVKFFDVNRRAVAQLAADPPNGLEEPFRTYANVLIRRSAQTSPLDYVREAGGLMRSGVRIHARAVAEALGGTLPPLTSQAPNRQTVYDCAKTHESVAKRFDKWRDWNILAYLDELRRTDGVEVVVVYWPIAHQPVDDCYSVRYTDASVAEFARWLQDETTARGLPYVDLHGLLSADLFLDSLHVSAAGHARIAAALADRLDPIVEDRAGRCPAGGTSCNAAIQN